MRRHPSRVWLPSILITATLLFLAPRLEAQCVISTTSSQMIGNAFTVLKVLTMADTCTPTVVMAMTCSPTFATATTGLLARATTGSVATMAVSCGWNCGCGQVTTDQADGLPVELMEFEILE